MEATTGPAVESAGVNWWGVFVLALGAWWLLGELGVAPFTWGVVAPLALMAWGVAAVLGRDLC